MCQLYHISRICKEPSGLNHDLNMKSSFTLEGQMLIDLQPPLEEKIGCPEGCPEEGPEGGPEVKGSRRSPDGGPEGAQMGSR